MPTTSFTFALNLLFATAAVGGVLAMIDGIIRARGNAAILAVIEITIAALFVLSLFVAGIPFGQLGLAIALVIVLVVQLVMRGSIRRGSVALTVVALVDEIALSQVWIVIPGVNS
jgi:hypothetical protein